MEREEGHGVDNGIDSRRGVDNGIDRDRGDAVVDVVNMPAHNALAFQVLLLKAMPRWNSISGIQQHSSRKRSSSNHEMGQQGTRPC